MKIFLTGATGTIGSAIAQNLQAAGHSVLALARSETAATKLAAHGIEVQRGDLQDSVSLMAGAQAAEAVIHTAMPSPMEMEMAEIGKLAFAVQQAFLAALAGSGKTLIITSGTGAYGDTGTAVVTEADPVLSDGPLGVLKQAEEMVLASGEREVRGLVIRPSIVYGHGRSMPVVMLVNGIRQLGFPPDLAANESHLATVHVDDLADLYRLALERSEPGELYNGVGENVAAREIVAAAAAAAGVAGPPQTLAPEQVQTLGFVGSYLQGNMRVSAEKARRLLGWEPHRPSIVEDLRSGMYTSQPTGS